MSDEPEKRRLRWVIQQALGCSRCARAPPFPRRWGKGGAGAAECGTLSRRAAAAGEEGGGADREERRGRRFGDGDDGVEDELVISAVGHGELDVLDGGQPGGG